MYRNVWRNLQLIGMLIALALTGLGIECRGQETTEPTFASQPTPSDEQEVVTIIFACQQYAQRYYETLAERFHEENPHIKVRVISQEEILGLGEDRRWPEDATYRLVSAADTLDGWWVLPRTTRQGLIRDLTPFIEADQGFHRQDFYPGALESLQWDGGTWGLPVSISFEMIFYDKEAFDEAGVAYPQPGWTWDDFLTKAQALTQREGDEVTRWGFVQTRGDLVTFVISRAGPLVDDSTTPPIPLLDEPEVIEAVRWYVDLHLKHQVTPFFEPPDVEPEGLFLPEGYKIVEEGKAAMWTDDTDSFPWRSQSKEIGMVPYPVDRPTDTTTPILVKSYVMSAGTAHPWESWRWLDFLTRHIDAGPYGFSSLPARRSVAAKTGIWEKLDEDVAAAYHFALQHAHPHNFAYTGAWRSLYEAMVAILKGEKNVEEALAEAQIKAWQRLSEEAKEYAQITPQPIVVATPEPVGEKRVKILFTSPFNVASYTKLAEAFHKSHPDITVEVRSLTFSDRVGLVEMAAASDCFAWFGMTADESSRHHILNLQPFLDADPAFSLADFYPQALKPFYWQGDLWGLPAEVLAKVIVYNQALFDAAEVAYPQTGWDLDDFLAKALALTQGEGEDKRYGFISLYGESHGLDTFIALHGVSLVNEERDPPWPRFDDPAVIKAVRWYVELSTVHEVKPLFLGEDPSRPETEALDRRWRLVDEGRVAMWTISPSDERMLSDSSDRRGVVPLPLNDGGAIPLTFLGYYISANTLYSRQCWTWLKFLSDHSHQIAQGLPARRSAAESPEYVERVGEEMAAAMRFSLQHSMFGSPIDQELWLVPTYWLQQALGQALQGQDVAQALGEAQRKAEAYILCLEHKVGFGNEEVQKTCAREVDPDYQGFGE